MPGKVGTDFDDDTLGDPRRRLGGLERENSPSSRGDPGGRRVHYVTPKRVCEVAFIGWTDDEKLRHLRYMGLRHDEDPEMVRKEGGKPDPGS